jgi:inositol-phosphate transport system substrate-binding protein
MKKLLSLVMCLILIIGIVGSAFAEEVVLKVRTKAGPPFEDWRGNNFVEVVPMLNEQLKQEGDARQVKLELIQDNKDWGLYKQEFEFGSKSGEAPDIILSGHEHFAAWVESGFVIALDDYIAKYPETYDDIFPSLWNCTMYKGKRWAVPQDAEARPLYWSKPLLKKLGWSDEEIKALPEKIKAGEFTLQDLLETAKEAVDKGVVEEGYGLWHRVRNGADFWYIYYNYGGQTYDEASGKLVYDKAVGLKHLKFYEDATQNYKVLVTDLFGREWPEWHTEVSSADKVLFWMGGTWNWGDWKVNYVAEKGGEEFLFENIGFGLIPAAEKGGKPVTLTHPLVYGVSSGSKHPDLAFRLITLITTKEANTKHAVESAHLGILKSQADYEPYKADRFLSEALYMIEYTTFLPNNPDWGTYSEAWFQGLQAVEAGDLTAEDAVEFVAEQLQNELGDRIIIK